MVDRTQDTTTVLVTASVTVAHAADICVVVPRVPPTAAEVRHIHDGLEQLTRRVKSGVGMLLVVAEQIALPSGEARRAVGEMFRAMRPHHKVIAAQLVGNGFVAAAKRSVFTWATSHMLGKTPIRAFSDLADATDWLHARATPLDLACPSSLDLQAFVREVSAP